MPGPTNPRSIAALALASTLGPSLQSASAQTTLVVGTDAGVPNLVRTFGPAGNQLLSFAPYAVGFGGTVRVTAGDINGDGFADIITGTGPGAAGGHVKVFDGVTGINRSFSHLHPFV